MAKAKQQDTRDETMHETMNGIGLGLAALDVAIRKQSGHGGPPGSGLHRLLSMAASQHFGLSATAFPDPAAEAVAAEAAAGDDDRA